MNTRIHPQAIVSDKASLDEGVEVGPFSVIEDNAVIGKNTRIGPHCLITGFTSIGRDCRIFKGAVLGSEPQDLKYKKCKSYVEIGRGNIIREFVTVNPGTDEGTKTVIGDDNLIMAYSHIAHNCKVGSNCILANAATLAGYVEIENRAVIGGLVAVHQFCRVGSLSIIGGCSKVVQDIPPFSLSDGHPAGVKSLNLVGLKRSGVSPESAKLLKKAFKVLFFENHTTSSAIEIIKKDIEITREIEYLLQFIQSSSRGIGR